MRGSCRELRYGKGRRARTMAENFQRTGTHPFRWAVVTDRSQSFLHRSGWICSSWVGRVYFEHENHTLEVKTPLAACRYSLLSPISAPRLLRGPAAHLQAVRTDKLR